MKFGRKLQIWSVDQILGVVFYRRPLLGKSINTLRQTPLDSMVKTIIYI
jgi:hypothetical protein